MWSNYLKSTMNCLLIFSAIIIASVQAQQHYSSYRNQYATNQQLVYEYHPSPQKTSPQQYTASAPAPPAEAPFPPVRAPAPSLYTQFSPAQDSSPLIRDPPSLLHDPFRPAQDSFPPVRSPTPISQASFPQAQASFPPVRAPAPITQAQAPINLNSRQTQGLITQIVEGSEQFTFDMIYAIGKAVESYDLNFVLSPFSVWSLMVLLAEGATDQTLDQLKYVLHLPNDLTQLRTAYHEIQQRLRTNTTAIEFTSNSAIFSNIHYRIDNKYVSTLAQAYNVEHIPVNFQNTSVAATTINDYIRIRTHGRIENVVQPDDLFDIQLLLSSSIFFRGQWKNTFNVSQTVSKPFFRENGDYLAHVPMMTQKNIFRYVTVASLSATFIELPYGTDQSRFAMLLIYPHTTLTGIFQQLCQTTTMAKIHEELDRHNNNDDDDDDMDIVELTLPKFKIDSDLELRTVFEHLGIVDLFDPTKAKLSKISRESPNLHVSRVFHKAIIDVDEVGTVATAISIAPISNRIIPKEFVFNRPFGFLISDRQTNTLLFSGQIKNPQVK